MVTTDAEGGYNVVHAFDGFFRRENFADNEVFAFAVHHMTAQLADDGKFFMVGIVEDNLVDVQFFIAFEKTVDKDNSAHACAADYTDFHMYILLIRDL